jgi:hypothetical protein
MALFQTSVLKKYLKAQEQAPVEKAYKKFTKFFHDSTIQNNIRDSKEEQFQALFLQGIHPGNYTSLKFWGNNLL